MKNKIKAYVKQFIHRAEFVARYATATSRALPDFMVVGAQKAGTTSLYDYLVKHPNVLPAFEKEIHYFDDGLSGNEKNYSKDDRWYRAHFPLRSQLTSSRITGEASPYYLFHPDAAKRIKEYVPGCKLLILLRNPSTRAISHYYHERRLGHEQLTLLQALEAEEGRTSAAAASNDYNDYSMIHHTYLARGDYLPQLLRFFDIFGPDNIHLEISEDFFTSTRERLSRVHQFLGLPAHTEDEYKIMNQNVSSRAVDRDALSYLSSYYAPRIQELDTYLNLDGELIHKWTSNDRGV